MYEQQVKDLYVYLRKLHFFTLSGFEQKKWRLSSTLIYIYPLEKILHLLNQISIEIKIYLFIKQKLSNVSF